MFKNIKRLVNFFINSYTLKRETYYINKKEKISPIRIKGIK